MKKIDILIKRGNLIISLPMILLMILTLIFVINIYEKVEVLKDNSIWYIEIIKTLSMMFFMVFIPVLYRSIVMQFWKINSFEKNINIHILKKRAIQAEIIYEESNLLTKLEIYTKKNKLKWHVIKEKLKNVDVFINDLNLKKETIINYPKPNPIYIIVILFFLLLGIIVIITTKKMDGLIPIIISVYIAYNHFIVTSYFNAKNQIIIKETGIKTINTDFYKWNEINNVKIVIEEEGYGKHKNYYLIYNHPKGTEKIKLNKLDVNFITLEYLINIHRGKHNIKINEIA